MQVLKGKKGNSYAIKLLNLCNVSEIPTSIKIFLEEIYNQFPEPDAVEPIQIEEDDEQSEDGTTNENMEN